MHGKGSSASQSVTSDMTDMLRVRDGATE